MKSKRLNKGKAMLGFILQFPTAMAAFARVKEMGAIKYERNNWKLGGKPDYEYLDAAMRHLAAHAAYLAGDGEYYAEDTGCSHLAHAAWNMWALQELNYPGWTHDPELFAAMAKYWAEEKERKKKEEIVANQPPVTVEGKQEPDQKKSDQWTMPQSVVEASDNMVMRLWERHIRDELRKSLEYLQAKREKREKDEQDDTEEPT